MNADKKSATDKIVGSSDMLEVRRFPVLINNKWAGCATFIPWSVLNEDWAQKIHNQSLTRLAERGGLDPVEIFCNVRRLSSWEDYHPKELTEAIAFVNMLASNRDS